MSVESQARCQVIGINPINFFNDLADSIIWLLTLFGFAVYPATSSFNRGDLRRLAPRKKKR